MLCLLAGQPLLAQNNNLAAGDLAFVGYTADPDGATVDQFSVVVVRVGGIPGSTVIYFTDNGWSSSSPANFIGLKPGITTNEGFLRWVVPAGGLPQGVEVRFSSTGTGAGITWSTTAGSVTTPSTFPMALASSGDQILVYQTGSTAGPAGNFDGTPIRFITAIHANVAVGGTSALTWDLGDAIGALRPDSRANMSNLPPGLTGGLNALLLATGAGTLLNVGSTSGSTPSESDAAKYQCIGLPSTNVSTVLSLVNNPANWAYADASFGTGVSSNCSFGSPLPVTLVRFTAQYLGQGDVAVNWVVAEQLGILRYSIEWSTNGTQFNAGGVQAASTLLNDQYRFIHRPGQSGNLYYRLRIEERDGSFRYSPTVLVTIRNGQGWTIFPNPVRNQLILQQRGTVITGPATLLGLNGQTLRQYVINQPQQTLSLDGLSAGVYVLRLADGSTQKFIKQ